MKTFYTQKRFLKYFPIVNGNIDCKGEDLHLTFNLDVKASIVNAGSIYIFGDIFSCDNIDAKNIKVCGGIDVFGDICSGGDIESKGYTYAKNIRAGGDIYVDDWSIIVTGDIDAGGYIYADGDIRSGGDINSKGDIDALYIEAKGNVRSDGKITINGMLQENLIKK